MGLFRRLTATTHPLAASGRVSIETAHYEILHRVHQLRPAIYSRFIQPYFIALASLSPGLGSFYP